MECFIKKIWSGKGEEVHSQFVRFGKGRFESKAIVTLHKTTKAKLKGSYEYVNDFVNLVSELVDVQFSGIVQSREQLDLENEKKKSGLYVYEVENLGSEKIKEIKDKVYAMLLDADDESKGIKLRIKKKLPKPGKSGEGKVNDKFCQLEADLKFYPIIKEAFFWDVSDCKKVKVNHIYEITDLVMPEGEKDFEQIRLKTKRKGKIIRKLEIDKKEQVKETNFES